MKNKQTHHHSGTRAGQYLLLREGPTRRNISCSATTITNDAQCIQLSARETNSQKLATRSLEMTNINNHKMRGGQ
jgi:hypothetical protein